MTVPWLIWHGSNMHKVIATSAATGLPIALAHSATCTLAGATCCCRKNQPGLSIFPHSLALLLAVYFLRLWEPTWHTACR